MRQILPGLFLGNVEASHNRALLRQNHTTAILSLTDARWVWWNSATRQEGVPEKRHKWVQCVDSSTQDLLRHMGEMCDSIDEMASSVLLDSSSMTIQSGNELDGVSIPRDQDKRSEGILIHCDLGISRSPTVITAYLMRKFRMKRDEVLAFVQTRQRVKPSNNMMRQLQVWDEVQYQVWADEAKTVPKEPYRVYLEEREARLREKGLTGDEPLAPLSLV